MFRLPEGMALVAVQNRNNNCDGCDLNGEGFCSKVYCNKIVYQLVKHESHEDIRLKGLENFNNRFELPLGKAIIAVSEVKSCCDKCALQGTSLCHRLKCAYTSRSDGKSVHYKIVDREEVNSGDYMLANNCPCCGSDKVLVYTCTGVTDKEHWAVSCKDCNLCNKGFETRGEAVAAWNRRA